MLSEEEQKPFEATLMYYGYWTGRSAITFKFKDINTGKIHYLFISELDKILSQLIDGSISGWWKLIQRGTATSLTYLGKDIK